MVVSPRSSGLVRETADYTYMETRNNFPCSSETHPLIPCSKGYSWELERCPDPKPTSCGCHLDRRGLMPQIRQWPPNPASLLLGSPGPALKSPRLNGSQDLSLSHAASFPASTQTKVDSKPVPSCFLLLDL